MGLGILGLQIQVVSVHHVGALYGALPVYKAGGSLHQLASDVNHKQ